MDPDPVTDLAPLERPCGSCPWRRDTTAADIPHFDIDLAEALAGTCPDAQGRGPDAGASMFACHASKVGQEFICAGWLAMVGRANVRVRLACRSGRIDPELLSPQPDWPALHKSYSDVLNKLRATAPSVERGAANPVCEGASACPAGL